MDDNSKPIISQEIVKEEIHDLSRADLAMEFLSADQYIALLVMHTEGRGALIELHIDMTLNARQIAAVRGIINRGLDERLQKLLEGGQDG
jgi:hypothetical protein